MVSKMNSNKSSIKIDSKLNGWLVLYTYDIGKEKENVEYFTDARSLITFIANLYGCVVTVEKEKA